MDNINALVPELSVTDYPASRDFYSDVLGFATVYERVEEGFGFLALDKAQVMLDQIGLGRDFGAMVRPLGRGVNLQITVDVLDPLLARLRSASISPAVGPETRWYRRNDHDVGQYQCVVADPDGYLLRLAQVLGTRHARNLIEYEP